mmetsp:Transcript_25122/g.62197  ORF Transcript_25122/g.62197 Transcript_25122/m.62197 type:complete len:139 (-) Transcript_25122:20-436(-)
MSVCILACISSAIHTITHRCTHTYPHITSTHTHTPSTQTHHMLPSVCLYTNPIDSQPTTRHATLPWEKVRKWPERTNKPTDEHTKRQTGIQPCSCSANSSHQIPRSLFNAWTHPRGTHTGGREGHRSDVDARETDSQP